MRYKKGEYSKNSCCSLCIAVVLLGIGFYGFFIFPSFFFDNRWLSLVPLFIGLSIIIRQIRTFKNRKTLRNIVKQEFESNPNVTVDQISSTTGITQRDVKAIILDLKSSGKLRAEASTGIEQAKPTPIEEKTSEQAQPAPEKTKICSNCGTQVKEKEEYCQYCGQKI